MVRDFLERIFWIETQLQLKHWQETRGFHHEKLDELHKEFQDVIDKLVECYLGDETKTIKVSESLFKLTNDVDISLILVEMKVFVTQLQAATEFTERGMNNIVEELSNLIERYTYILNRQ